jgi:hypothetical protein
VQARLQVVGGTHADLVALREWLAREPAFRGKVGVEEPIVDRDTMGGLAEILVVGVGAGGTLTVLAGSVSVWLEQRRSDISIEVTNPDGSTAKITAKGRAADTVAKNLDPDRK